MLERLKKSSQEYYIYNIIAVNGDVDSGNKITANS